MTPSQFTAAQDLIARSDVTPAKTSLGGSAHRMTRRRAGWDDISKRAGMSPASAGAGPETERSLKSQEAG